MSAVNIIELVCSIIGVIILPVLFYVIRVTARWASVEEKLSRVVADVDKLVRDRDTTQAKIIDMMNKDREATDLRLRWLENHLWVILGRKEVP